MIVKKDSLYFVPVPEITLFPLQPSCTDYKSHGDNTSYGRITLQNRCFSYINNFLV